MQGSLTWDYILLIYIQTTPKKNKKNKTAGASGILGSCKSGNCELAKSSQKHKLNQRNKILNQVHVNFWCTENVMNQVKA